MKRIAIVTVLVLMLLAGLAIGCTEKGLTEDEVNQIVTKVLDTNSTVKTCQFKLSLQEVLRVERARLEADNSTQDIVNMSASGAGTLDSQNKAMKMVMSMTVDAPGEDKQNIPVETYLVDGVMYTRVSVQGSDQWMKMVMPEGIWEKQNELYQQSDLLSMAEDVKYLGVENVDGTECYLVEVTPSSENLKELLSGLEMLDVPGLDTSKLNLADIIKEISFKQWVAKDSYLFVKTTQHMSMEMRPEDFGATEADFQKMIVSADTEMVFFGYNEPISIQLPGEALEAVEVTGN